MIVDVLEWVGALFVLAGYFLLGRAHVTLGVPCSMVGSACFLAWGFSTGNNGVGIMNVAILLSLCWSNYKILRKSRTKE